MDTDSEKATIQAVIWDYDGTLVDTRRKNWQVTRAMIPAVTGRPVESFPDLASLEAYQAADRKAENWRELLGPIFGLNEHEVDEAGRLWTSYQLRDRTPAPFFPGTSEAIARLGDTRQAIFSQNSKAAIEQSLTAAGLADYFELVVGYEEVSFQKQKPAPDGLLFCLGQLKLDQGTVLFVGDHDTDIECARRANVVLERDGIDLRVASIGAEFGGESPAAWKIAPDHVARRPAGVVELAKTNRQL
ncbi:MAG: HAD family hydrolase [Chloroflexota bacterium]|nr:MAG: HAD family hydrolase [Chloroflexota bacterium]